MAMCCLQMSNMMASLPLAGVKPCPRRWLIRAQSRRRKRRRRVKSVGVAGGEPHPQSIEKQDVGSWRVTVVPPCHVLAAPKSKSISRVNQQLILNLKKKKVMRKYYF